MRLLDNLGEPFPRAALDALRATRRGRGLVVEQTEGGIVEGRRSLVRRPGRLLIRERDQPQRLRPLRVVLRGQRADPVRVTGGGVLRV